MPVFTMRINNKTAAQLLGIVVVFSAAIYLLYYFSVFELFTDKDRLLSFISQHRTYAAVIFIGLQILQVVAAPIPGEVTGFVGGVIFGTLWGIIYSTIGLTCGSLLAFLLARWIGRPLVEKLVTRETITRYDYIMKHKGMFLAFLMFLIPGFPKDYLCYLLGLGHMGLISFLIVSTFGRLLGTTLLTMGGTFFRAERYYALSTVAGFGIAILLFTMIYRNNIERWFRKIRAAQHQKSRARRKRRNGQER
jgi:uncharacterized membrane protein YdjX (TVP38/TMEM64 family)